MKKSVFLSFFLACILMSNAWGACAVQSRANKEKNNNTLWIDGQEGQAYVCSQNHEGSNCWNNAVVFVPQYSKVWHYKSDDESSGTTQTEGPAYCTCYEGGQTDDRWKCVNTINMCDNSPIKNANIEGTEKIYTTAGQFAKSSTKTQLNGMNTISTATGGTPCYVYVCKGNKIPNSDGTACIENTDKNNCESTGGTWQDGSSKCDCSGNSDLEQDGDKKCKCINKGGQSYRWSGSACVTGKSGLTYSEVQTANANWQKTQTANKQACEASGGTYNKTCSCTAEHTSLQGSECVCNSGYKWKSNKKDGCEPTDNTMVELACKAAADKGQAQWNPYPSPGQCICKENGYVLDVNARECKPNEQRAICQPLINANKARWDDVTGTCVCSQAGYELVGNACVETEAAAAARKDKEMKSAKNKIEDVHSKLKRVQDGFKVSAWKNEEGKFNTARLASDSIAGVVLGTAGGLVTSKVVKKNQVENGFEDIQCTIGGQAVAQWGDDFSVGTQF